MFGALVVLYLFLGGCGAGVMCTMALWSLVFHRSTTRSGTQTEAFDRLKARCYTMGFIVLVFAAVCLLFDLGRPELFFLLFTRPTFSILTFGSFTLLAIVLIAGFLMAVNTLYVPFVHARARKIAEILCVVVSLCMMGYTGIYVACVEAVPLWNTASIPLLFVLSSLSSGLSSVFIVIPFVRDEWLLGDSVALLHRVHLGALILEMVAIAIFLGVAAGNPFAHASLQLLVGSEGFGGWFLVGVIGLGVLVPLAAEVYMVLARRAVRLLPIDVLCVAGGLILRFCVVWSGMH